MLQGVCQDWGFGGLSVKPAETTYAPGLVDLRVRIAIISEDSSSYAACGEYILAVSSRMT